jgi:ribonucleoside-diphosphate reductase alpha chain
MSDADVKRGEIMALRWAATECRRAADEIEMRASTKASAGAVAALRAVADSIVPGPSTPSAAAAQEPAQAPQWMIDAVAHPERPDASTRLSEARAKGYTGDECRECGSMQMVRNGTCLKCTVCGSTTGCS